MLVHFPIVLLLLAVLREEALPLLQNKFCNDTESYLDKDRCDQVLALPGDSERFHTMPVGDFMRLMMVN